MSPDSMTADRAEEEPPAAPLRGTPKRIRKMVLTALAVVCTGAIAYFVLRPEPRDCGLDKCGRTAQMELPPVSDDVDFDRFVGQSIPIDFPVTNDRCAFLDETDSGGAPGTKGLNFECPGPKAGDETEIGEVDVVAQGLPATFLDMYPPHQPECAAPEPGYPVYWCSYSTGRLRIVARSVDLGTAQIRLGSVHKMLLEASAP